MYKSMNVCASRCNCIKSSLYLKSVYVLDIKTSTIGKSTTFSDGSQVQAHINKDTYLFATALGPLSRQHQLVDTPCLPSV